MKAVQIENLVKYYGKVKALDGIDLGLEQGEVMGFIGPNGAGKTTTIRIILGLLKKTSGMAKLFGQDAWHDATRLHSKLAYVPDDVPLWPNLSGGEVIDLLGKLRGGIDETKRSRMLDRFQLDPTKKCRTYSKGNRQKVALVSAFSSNAELFIMDEPTTGLDPLMESVFQESVNELKNDGKTVLLSSHILAVVEKLCDRVSIIRQGRIVETGTLSQLRHLTRTTIEVETAKPVETLRKLTGIHDLSIDGHKARFQIEGDKLQEALNHLVQHDVKAMTSNPPTLEELFMHHYNHDSDTTIKNRDGGDSG